jgi:hypothetical protein
MIDKKHGWFLCDFFFFPSIFILKKKGKKTNMTTIK